MKFTSLSRFFGATAAAVIAIGFTTASATVVVDVDGTNYLVDGTTQVYEANEGGGSMPNAGGRFKSVTLSGSDRTAVTGTLTTKIDYYLQWNNISSDGLDAATYKYAKIDYTLAGGWAAGEHKLRLGDTVSVTGTVGDNDAFSNPEVLNTASALADGAHSFIVDLTADVTYDGNWKYLRWNFFNDSANTSSVDGSNEQSLTIDKITYATSITAVPEPSSLAVLAVGGAGVLIRRRKRNA